MSKRNTDVYKEETGRNIQTDDVVENNNTRNVDSIQDGELRKQSSIINRDGNNGLSETEVIKHELKENLNLEDNYNPTISRLPSQENILFEYLGKTARQVSVNIQVPDKDGNPTDKKIPILFFSKSETIDYDHFNIYKGKYENEIIGKFWSDNPSPIIVPLSHPTSEHAVHIIKNLCAVSMTSSRYKYTNDIEFWLEKMAINSIKPKKKKSTPIYGTFLNKESGKFEFLSAHNADLMIRGEYFNTEMQGVLDVVMEDEKEICDVKFDKDKAARWLKLIQELPQNKENRDIIYNLFSISCASLMRCALFDLGCNMMPYVVILGHKGEGKSRILLDLLVNSIHNIKEVRNEQSLRGTGIRLKNITIANMRPNTIDDISDISKVPEIKSMIKSGATAKFGALLTRGTKDQKVHETKLTRNIILTANEINIDDEALFERFLMLNVSRKFKHNNKILTTEELEFLNDNGLQIGYLLNKIIQELTVEEIKEIIKEAKLEFPNRLGDKLSVINVGLYIIKKMYREVGLKFNEKITPFTNNARTNVVDNKKETMNSAMFKVINNTQVILTEHDGDHKRDRRVNIFELKRRLGNSGEPTKEEQTALYSLYDKGIYLSRDKDGIIFQGKSVKGMLNENLSESKISTLMDLAEKLNEIGINCRYFGKDENEPFFFNESKYLKCGVFIPFDSLFQDMVEIKDKKQTSLKLEKVKESNPLDLMPESSMILYMDLLKNSGMNDDDFDNWVNHNISYGNIFAPRPGYLQRS